MTVTMSTPLASASPRDSLEAATRLIKDVSGDIAGRATDAALFGEALTGVHRVVGTLTELVRAMMDRAPGAFDGDGYRIIGDELVRDLRAMHGCLTTAGLLVEPAVNDLRALAPAQPDAPDGEAQLDDAIPVADRAEEHLSAIAVIDGNGISERAGIRRGPAVAKANRRPTS